MAVHVLKVFFLAQSKVAMKVRELPLNSHAVKASAEKQGGILGFEIAGLNCLKEVRGHIRTLSMSVYQFFLGLWQ